MEAFSERASAMEVFTAVWKLKLAGGAEEYVGTVISYLFSMGTDAFLSAGALPHFCPRLLGISPVASFVKLGIRLLLINEAVNCSNCLLCNHM